MAPSFQGGGRSWELQAKPGSVDLVLPARGVTRSVVGPGRLELPTSRLSGVCSNQLSYRPLKRSARQPGDQRPAQRRMRDRTVCLAAAVSAERETETATPRTYLVSSGRPIGRVSILEVHP